MKKNRTIAANLRKKAEEVLKKRSLESVSVPTESDSLKLLHELEVHQIELEMQNEELVLAKELADAASKKYIELYDFAPTGYLTLSREGVIIEVNLRGADILGKERKNLINSRFIFFVSDFTRPIFNIFLSNIFNRQSKQSCELTLATDDKTLKYIYLTGLPDENGVLCNINMVDISDRKRAEEKLKTKTEELIFADKELAFRAELILANAELIFQNKDRELRSAELVVTNSKLEQFTYADQELSQFAYIASHELQEPIRTIYNFLQIFEEDYKSWSDDKALEFLHTMKDATKRMAKLINSLLQYSRLGHNSKIAMVNCKQLIDNVIIDLGSVITASDAIIEVGEMPELNLCETEIRQLFQNLILNAIKFRKKETNLIIQILSEKVNEEYKFSVSDNGIGIAPEHFENIFDIFQRLSDDRETTGSGIGLAYCKKIVKLHRGEIWVESKLGKGSTFYFTLPNLTI
jgi:signal transduction histidine kinase